MSRFEKKGWRRLVLDFPFVLGLVHRLNYGWSYWIFNEPHPPAMGEDYFIWTVYIHLFLLHHFFSPSLEVWLGAVFSAERHPTLFFTQLMDFFLSDWSHSWFCSLYLVYTHYKWLQYFWYKEVIEKKNEKKNVSSYSHQFLFILFLCCYFFHCLN